MVPDLATFAVDDGFAYRVPPEMDGLTVGSLVRVPLGARRVRGYVVSTRTGPVAGLKPVISISGDHPAYDERLLQTLRWAALHYVAPLAVLLGRSTPPNLPRGKGRPPTSPLPELSSPLPAVSAAASSAIHSRPTCLLTAAPYAGTVGGLARDPMASDRNVAVVVPTIEEATSLATELRASLGDRVLAVSSALPASEATRHWVTAATQVGLLIVGTPEIALWPLGTPALWIVVEEARRAMKSKQTPTLQVRDLVRRRALVERSAVVFLGPVPTVDTLARGAEVVEPPGRVWPLVELVDRREEPPSGRPLAGRTIQAIAQAAKRGGRVFVFVSRRRLRTGVSLCPLSRAATMPCVRCGTRSGGHMPPMRHAARSMYEVRWQAIRAPRGGVGARDRTTPEEVRPRRRRPDTRSANRRGNRAGPAHGTGNGALGGGRRGFTAPGAALSGRGRCDAAPRARRVVGSERARATLSHPDRPAGPSRSDRAPPRASARGSALPHHETASVITCRPQPS